MIYVHVPYCRSFCTYCAFYSEISRSGDYSGYVAGVLREISERRAAFEEASSTDTLYFGGGTPSLLSAGEIATIVGALPGFPFGEFTLEANPDDILRKGGEYLSRLRGIGVNRISMGVQSLSDRTLRLMGRRHDSAAAVKAFRMLREAGFDNISLDVIFGYPSDNDIEKTVSGIVALRPEHISAYQLGVEEGSALEKLCLSGRTKEKDDEDCRREYDMVCSKLREAGYEHYEISSWALPSRRSRHNSAYWARVPYVGLGPGAHSFDGKRRSWNSCTLPLWTSESEILTPRQEREESIMLGLRTSDGIPPSLLDGKTLDRLLSEGCLVRVGERVRIPESRFFVSDDIISDAL